MNDAGNYLFKDSIQMERKATEKEMSHTALEKCFQIFLLYFHSLRQHLHKHKQVRVSSEFNINFFSPCFTFKNFQLVINI